MQTQERRTVRHFILMTVLILAGIPQAGASAEEGDGSNWGKITAVYVDAKGSVLRVVFSRPVVNPSGCEGGDFYVRELDDSAASDRFVKTVLAAHLANREVEFWVYGCTKSRWWGKFMPKPRESTATS
jgi:hypothetical protein